MVSKGESFALVLDFGAPPALGFLTSVVLDLGLHLAPGARGIQWDPLALDIGVLLALGVHWLLIWGRSSPGCPMFSKEPRWILINLGGPPALGFLILVVLDLGPNLAPGALAGAHLLLVWGQSGFRGSHTSKGAYYDLDLGPSVLQGDPAKTEIWRCFVGPYNLF